MTGGIYQNNAEMGWSGYKELERGMLVNLAFTPHPGVSIRDIPNLKTVFFAVNKFNLNAFKLSCYICYIWCLKSSLLLKFPLVFQILLYHRYDSCNYASFFLLITGVYPTVKIMSSKYIVVFCMLITILNTLLITMQNVLHLLF